MATNINGINVTKIPISNPLERWQSVRKFWKIITITATSVLFSISATAPIVTKTQIAGVSNAQQSALKTPEELIREIYITVQYAKKRHLIYYFYNAPYIIKSFTHTIIINFYTLISLNFYTLNQN